MRLADALQELEARGVRFAVEGDQLRFRGPKGSLTDAHRALLGERRAEVIELLRANARERSERVPLSPGQQSMWLTERFSPGGPANNLATAVRVGVAADPEASRVALQALLDRHAMLRATFTVDDEGELVQRVSGGVAASIDLRDARGLSEAALAEVVREARERPFDLERGPPIRLVLIRLGEVEHLQLLVVHHIVSDGGSVMMLMIELISRWLAQRTDEPLKLEPLPATYADYVERQAEQLAGPKGEELWSYWRDQLAGAPGEVALPYDRPREAITGFRSDAVEIALDEALLERLFALGRETGVTNFTLFLTLYEMFLAQLSGVTDVVVGSAFSDRPADCQWVIGDFVNPLPIRAQLRWGMSLREALAQQQTVVRDAIERQAYPVQRLIERLRPERSTGGSPLFNCYFNYAHMPVTRELTALVSGGVEGLTHQGIEFKVFPVPQPAGQFDLAFSLGQSGTRVTAHLDYSTDLFDRATIERMAGEFLAFLRCHAANPDETLLARDDRRALLEGFNDTARAVDERPFVEQLLARALAHADRPAVRFGEQTVSYAELLASAQALARRLREAGAGRGAVVGISMDRSPTMLAALLAVQLTGAAYLPLDPAYPASRLAFMAADSGMAVLVSDRGRPEWTPPQVALVEADAGDAAADAWSAPSEGPKADDLAYILYTSGSTGQPKGVRIAHRALANFLASMLVEPGIRESDMLAAVTTISFDIAALELYAPLLAGATIDLLPQKLSGDGAAIAARLAEAGATVMQATPTQWRQLVETDWAPPADFVALSGGEPLPADLAAALLSRGVTLWNLYGPTETTVWSTVAQVRDASAIDVGRPIANTRVYVLDRHLDVVPLGHEGDIWIGGAGVAQGYHGRADLTAQQFQPDPFAGTPGARMYRTGDTGRWQPDGTLIHLGRSDEQIKLRGYRIELGEIEAALAALPEVSLAVVVPRSAGDDVRLVAFLVPARGQTALPQQLRRHLRDRLPEYMVPAMFVELAEIPTTPNGKVDRKALPNPLVGASAGRATGALEGEIEHTLAALWQEVLGIESVGPGDNFFELGGHSLLAIKVATLMRRRSGHQIPPESLFFHTLREVAAALQEADTPRSGLSRLQQAWRKRRRAVVA